MSQDFKKVLINDSRLYLTDEPVFAVCKTGQQVTTSVYNALAQSTSNITLNIIPPSTNIVIDPYLPIETDMTIRVDFPTVGGVAATANTIQWQYGLSEALAPYPLQGSCSTISATINNTIVTLQSKDVLPVILRACNKEMNQKVVNGEINYPDYFFNFEDALGNVNNPLSGFDTATDDFLKKRGSKKLVNLKCFYGNTPVAGAQDLNSSLTFLRQAQFGAGVYVNAIEMTFNVREPLLISPFVFTDVARCGIMGVNTIALNFNIGNASRAYSVARYYADPANPTGWAPRVDGYTYSFSKFENTRAIVTYLTPYPSQMLPARNCVNFYQLNRYQSQPGVPMSYASNKVQTLTTNSLQLNAVPDKIFLYVTPAPSQQDNYTPMSFLKINKLSVQFNNSTGLLSTLNSYDLYRLSSMNGIDMSYEEFNGEAMVCKVPNTGNYQTARNGPAVPLKIPLCGSILCLSLATDLSLVEEWLAPGVIGTYNLTISVEVELQQTEEYPLSQVSDLGQLSSRSVNIPALGTPTNPFIPQVMLVLQNSGLFVTESGTSSQYTAVLSASDVITASKQKPAELPMQGNGRLIGGSWLDDIKSVVRKVAPVVKTIAETAEGLAGAGVSGAGVSGAGVSGAGVSGAGMSGGRSHKKNISQSLRDRLR